MVRDGVAVEAGAVRVGLVRVGQERRAVEARAQGAGDRAADGVVGGVQELVAAEDAVGVGLLEAGDHRPRAVGEVHDVARDPAVILGVRFVRERRHGEGGGAVLVPDAVDVVVHRAGRDAARLDAVARRERAQRGAVLAVLDQAAPAGRTQPGEDGVVAAGLEVAGVLDRAARRLRAHRVRGGEHVDLGAVDPQPAVVEGVLGPVEQDVVVGVGGVLHGGLHQAAAGELEDELLSDREVDASGELGHPDRLGLPVGRADDRRVGGGGGRIASGGPGVERSVRVRPALPAGRELGAQVVDVDGLVTSGVVLDGERDGRRYGLG